MKLGALIRLVVILTVAVMGLFVTVYSYTKVQTDKIITRELAKF